MNLTWYIQSSINIEAHDRTFDICEELNIPFVSVPIIPFSLELPEDIEFTDPAIPYGSTTYVTLSRKHPILSKYTYYDDDLLAPTRYHAELGNRCLNAPFYVGPIRDMPVVEDAFVRCNSDSKAIAGGMFTREDIEELKSVTTTMYEMGNIISPDLEIVMSEYQEINLEARTIFVNGEYLTGSTYRQNCKRQRERLTQEKFGEVIDFAKDCVKIYNPFDVTVCDICNTPDGLKCVEYNCFNASGWYDCDYKLIVQEVTNFINGESK